MFGHTPTTKYFPVGSDSKRSAYNVGDPEFNPWIGKISWRRKWQPTPVFLPAKSHGWRNLVGSCPWGRKELAMTEQLHFTSHKDHHKSLHKKFKIKYLFSEERALQRGQNGRSEKREICAEMCL